MAGKEGKEMPVRDSSAAGTTGGTDSFSTYRTKVDYNKPYLDPAIDPLIDTYDTLCGDIRRMKNLRPVPEAAVTEAEEELTELKVTMKQAGFVFFGE